MRKGFLFPGLAFLSVWLFFSPVVGQTTGQTVYSYESPRFGTVVFDHDRHRQRAGDCTACHHEEAYASCSICHGLEPGVPLRKDVFHKICKDCHRARKIPVTCADCHKRPR